MSALQNVSVSLDPALPGHIILPKSSRLIFGSMLFCERYLRFLHLVLLFLKSHVKKSNRFISLIPRNLADDQIVTLQAAELTIDLMIRYGTCLLSLKGHRDTNLNCFTLSFGLMYLLSLKSHDNLGRLNC